MTCDLCGKFEASVYLTEIINGETRELHLCGSCAREKGQETIEHFSATGLGGSVDIFGGGLAGLLAGLADSGLKPEGGEPKKAITCPRCRMTYEDFRKMGRLGCGSCYEAFHRSLAPLLKRIHGSTRHVGRVPAQGIPKSHGGEEELARLKESLVQAITAEAFEEAARLRDKIRAAQDRQKRPKPAKNFGKGVK